MDIRQPVDSFDDLKPAIPPPPGVVPNLENPPNRQWATIFAMVLYIATTTIFLAIRIFTRLQIHAKLWWDDYCMILGWAGLLTFAGLVFETLKYGNATDEWNVSKAHAAHMREIFSTIEIIARLGIFFTKTSILLLYLRYFCPAGIRRSALRIWTWSVIIFNLLYCIALILTVTLQCVGRHREPGQSCVNSWAVLIGASSINVVTDLIMLAIPISVVWNLRLPRTRKIGLWIMFSFAGLAVIASVARLGYQIPQAKSPNQTMLITNVAILALAEHAIGIIVGSMPLLPSFYSYIRKYFETIHGGSRTWQNKDNFQMAPPRRRVRGQYNDTSLLATENADFNDNTTLRHENRDNEPIHGDETAIGTAKLSTVNESSSEPSLPSEARLHDERNPRWPLV